jgi:hypothetical protein
MSLFEAIIARLIMFSAEKAHTLVAKHFDSIFPATKRAHFNELRSRLRQMPFIYRPLGDQHVGEDLLADYVQARMRPVDLLTLESIWDVHDPLRPEHDDLTRFDLSVTYEMVRENRTCLIFGHAGVGKTTFASYSVLSAINRLIVEGFYPFHRDERPIPFIVPLKVVDETKEYPILSYLLQSNRFLSAWGAWGGLRRLVRLCQKGRVLLVLDGYDEVYGSSESSSALRNEIEAIFDANIPITEPNRPPARSVLNFYYYLALGKNRVWLTTRKDYYRQNRLRAETKRHLTHRVGGWLEHRYSGTGKMEIGYYGTGDPGIAPIEILGVWQRIEFARKIFDRYRKAKPDFSLNESKFLEFVDSHYDDETRRLSLNPLFLTVMCYVYVEHQLKDQQSVGNTLRDLVSECVRLLVHELDRLKVRLPDQKAGQALQDRLAFPKEKIEFLQYFASRSFCDRDLLLQKVFTSDTLEASATKYSVVSKNKELAKNAKSFVRQLIDQGVFVVADASSNTTYYDFPHRRFREILGVQYWDRRETLREFLSLIAEPHFAEFVLIFFATSEGNQDALLEEMLRGIDESQRGAHLASLASSCLENAPSEYSPNRVINNWVQSIIAEAKSRELPVGVMKHFDPDPELVGSLFFKLGESTSRENQNQVRFYATLLVQISPQTIERLFKDLMTGPDQSVAETIAQVVLKHRREFVPPLLEHVADNEFVLLSETALSMIPATDRRWWLLVLRCLGPNRKAILNATAGEYAPSVASAIRLLERREALIEAIENYLLSDLPDFEIERKSDSDETEEVFKIGPGPFSYVGPAILKKKTPLTADLVFEPTFLNSSEASAVAAQCRKMGLADRVRENPEKRLSVSQTTVSVITQRIRR